MFRRSRFNARPNVGTVGRAAATPQEAPSATQDAGETPKDVSESSTATDVADNTSVGTPSEKPAAPGDGNDQNAEGTSSSAAVQRRKRFSIKPKVAPGRPSAAARMTKSPVKAVSETPIDVPDKSSQTGTTAAPQRLQSPRRRRPSEESKQQLKTQPKPSLISSDGSEPSAAPTAVDSVVQTHDCFSADSGKEVGSVSGSQVKEVPSRPPDKVPFSIPDREAIALSEKAKTLMSSKSGPSLSLPAFSLSRLLNDPSDLQRLAKARKLRDLLKQEMHKEKKLRKTNKRVKEYDLDPAKMTMRDLIRYLPVSNPMTSSLEDSVLENETVVPASPVREESPERAQEPAVITKIASPREEEEEEAAAEGAEAAEEGAEEAEEDEDDDMMVPQVKVAEDGSLIIDEESLTVEVQRAKGPNLAQDRDPIFERGSTTTYSSFRKGTYSKPWSSEETDMFFLAISMVGTDFSMICQLFPHRARSEIKNKFKKEEKENSWRIDKAFRERRKLDIEYFSKLLEKIMEVQKNRKKLKSLAGKKSPKKNTRKAKGKKASRKLSVVEEEDEEEQNEIPDEEEEGEKENEDLCNEGGTAVAQPKKKRKRKSKQEASTEEPNDKKNKTGEKTTEQDEANIPGDAEAALPEDRPTSDMSEKTETVGEVKDATIKPAKLSRGRAPKPLLPLGRKWGKKAAAAATKTDDTTPNKGDESVIDGASEEQVNKDAASSPLKQTDNRQSANDDEEDAAVQPPRPTRYGRVPKATKLLNYPAKEETAPASPTGSPAARPKPKCPAKRGRSSKLQSAQESKKPKLVTLRATQSEYSDEEDDKQREEEEEEELDPACCSSQDVFVPASLRSPNPVFSEVEETMEELDILATMPDVLGISQDALCPDASFERAHNETGTAEPFEHQLDLLVDVIDFLSSDHTEVSADQSYNEAAQTLLTIGNLAHLAQSAQNQIDMQDDVTGTTSASVNETSQPLEDEIASKPAVQEEIGITPLTCAASVCGVTETVPTVELRSSTKDNDDVSVIERIDSDMDPTPQLQSPESSKTNSPQTRRGHVSRVKAKPNLGQASRTAQLKSQSETSTERTSEESHTVSQTTDTLSTTEETSETADCGKRLSKDDVSCIEVKHTVEPSGSQERSVGPVEPSRELAITDSRLTSQSTEEVPMSQIEMAESIFRNLLTSDAAVTESQIGQESNVVSALVLETSNHPAPCVAPVEELPVGQIEENQVPSTQQTRKSRFQKVKPKVNLAQTSRAVRSKPQTTKDTVEKDPTPDPKFHEKTIVEAKAEPTCSASPEKPSESHGPASILIPSLDLGMTLTPTEELSTTEEKNPDVGVVVQVESGAAASHQSSSENQNLSEAQFAPRKEQTSRDTRPTSESTDEVMTSPVRTAETSCDNLLTSDAAVTESHIGRESNVVSAPVPESSDHPAPCVTPVEELPVDQIEENQVSSTHQTRKSRFQKVKPKVNLAQTSRAVRSKPQTTKDTVEKDPTPDPKFHEKTILEAKAEPTCSASPEKPSESHGPASILIPTLDLGMTLTPTEELSTTEEKNPDVGVVVQVESDAAASHQSSSENQNLSEAQFAPSKEQTSRDTRPTSESTDKVMTSPVRTAETSCDNLLISEAAVTESQIGQESNVVSAPVPESSNHPAPCVTPVEELPVDQIEENQVSSTHQTRKSRFQKVKPKVNLAQASRTIRSKPQTTKDTVEKDPTPDPKFHEKTIVEAKSEPSCSASPEKPSESHDPASVLIPSLDLGMTLTPTDELSTTEEKNPDVGVVVQVESHAAASHQSASENQNLSEAHFEPSKEQTSIDTTPTLESTDKVLTSPVRTAETSCDNLLTSDAVVTESHIGQESNVVSAPVPESSDHPASCVTPVEELPVGQIEENQVASTQQTRKSRFQKVKPKVNLAQASRTVRSKPQTTKDTVEKDPTPDPKFHEKTIVEAKSEPSCSASPEKPSESHDPASVLIPSLDLGMTLTPTDELSTTEEKNPDVGVVVQVESDAAASHQSASENQNLSETQFAPSKEQTSRDTTLTPESTDEKLTSRVGHTERLTESEVKRGSNTDSVPVQESSDRLASHVEESPVSQEEEVKSACQTTRGRLQKVKPNLPQMTRVARSRPQTTKDPIAPRQPAETPSGQTSRPESTDDILAKVEAQPTCSTTAPETLRQTASVPSLKSCSTHQTTEELSSTEEQKAEVGRGLDSNSEGSEQNVPRRRFPKVKPKPNLGSSPRTTRAKLQSDDVSKAPEQMDASLTSEPQPSDNNGAQTEQEPVESGKSLDGRNNKDTSSDGVIIATPWVAETQSASTDSVVENKSGEKLTVESTGDETSESRDAVQLCSETSQPAAQSTVDKKSAATESPSTKGPQTRRGRLIKPKPRLGRSTIRPPQPQQVQNTKQAEADLGTCSEGHKLVYEHPPDIQQPVEGAIEQVPDSCTQDASTSRTGGTQNPPGLTLFPDLSVLSQPLPSDPDEPFFILSLTEIPVCPSGEVEEPLPYLPVTDASIEQRSVPGEGLAAAAVAGDGSLSNVTVPVSMETPVDPHESTTVHPANLPETGENKTTKQRPMGTRRKAKLEPDTTKGKQASESVAAKEAESAQRSEVPGPSVQPNAFDDAVAEPQRGSGDHVGGGERPENIGSEAQTSRARGARSRNRNANDSLSLSSETTTTAHASDSGRGRAASRGQKVRTRGGKRSAPTRSATRPTLSTSSITSSITSPTRTELQDVGQTSERGRSPNTSSCPAEVSVAMETSSIEEEPTNVSQYFLSDIFTDVDEA